ncbi:catalase [Zavarzinella formosa]|uniref:catalase n=1 Tax=Zavarzinella formosa TaxID=360055 RepID=UPI0003100AB3|nr:catalase [Zavarzinella formosa]
MPDQAPSDPTRRHFIAAAGALGAGLTATPADAVSAELPAATNGAKPANGPTTAGTGGETHQTAGAGSALTTQQGVPVADDQNTLRAGARGPALLEDFHFREKIFHFDHERIPERVVHARGFGAHGFFESNGALAGVSRAAVFKKGEKTPVFVRFSTVAGSKGSADLARDVRGFATKFYTTEGNWDLVGNNMPVFFIQDPMKFPDMVHAFKEEPDRGFPQAATAHDNAWDFISLTPESMNMVMWVYSDRGIPRSFRFMEGFGVHTFRLVDAAGKSTFVKFHWKPKLGLQSVVWNEAVKINGADPDYHRRDLWDAIQAEQPAEWELGVQLFDEAFAARFAFDVLDPTKIIPEEEAPVQIVGRMVLDRTVDNFFAETEQVAFCTQNVVPGIDFSNDPLLQGRNFSYLDTQLKRLGGPNFTHLPINAPKAPVRNFQQDGHMAMRNPKGRANYEPNSWADQGGPREAPAGFKTVPETVEGTKIRVRPDSFADHYSQARQFYVSQTAVEQGHLADALIFELSKVQRPDIRTRMVSHLLNIDKALADKVALGLRLAEMPKPMPAARPTRQDLKSSDKLSILKNGPKTFAGRKVGVLVTDGADANLLKALAVALKAEGAAMTLIAPEVGGVKASDGAMLPADEKLEGAPSVLFDAVVLLTSAAGAEKLAGRPAARDFVADALAHNKFIGHVPTAAALLRKAGAAEKGDDGMISLEKPDDCASFVTRCRMLRFWDRK